MDAEVPGSDGSPNDEPQACNDSAHETTAIQITNSNDEMTGFFFRMSDRGP